MSYRVTFRGTYNTMSSVLTRYNRELASANYKVATGKAINTPSDDPVAMVSILSTRSQIAALTQYQSNMEIADSWLKTADTALTSASDLLSRARELAEQMATSTYSAQNRSDAATEVEGLISSLLEMANTKIGNNYIFAGDRTSTTPFHQSLFINDPVPDLFNSESYCGVVTAGGTYYQGHARLDAGFSGLGGYEYLADMIETSQTEALNYSGYFSFYYDNDGDFTGANSEVADIFGFPEISATMTLQDIQDLINQGTAARGTLTFDVSAVSNDFISIGNTTYEFVNSAGAVGTISGAVLISMGAAAASAGLVMSALLRGMNGTSTADTWAVMSAGDTDTITLFAKTNGTTGNTLTLRANTDLGTWAPGSTAALDMSATLAVNTQETALSFAAGSTALDSTGQFAFWYDSDGSGGTQDVADLFALFNVTSGTTSLEDIVSAINQGTAARAVLSIAGDLSVGELITIGSTTFEVVSDTDSPSISTYIALSTGAGASNLGAADAYSAILNALNAGSGDIWAVQSTAGSSLTLFARETGLDGNTIVVSGNSGVDATLGVTSLSSGATLSGGGQTDWASAVLIPTSQTQDVDGSGYTLRIVAAGSEELSFATTSTGGGYLASFGGVDTLNGDPAWVSSVSGALFSFAGGGSQWVTADIVSGASGFQLKLTGEDSNAVTSTGYQIYLASANGPLNLISGVALSFFSEDYNEPGEWSVDNTPLMYLFADEEGSAYNDMAITFVSGTTANAALSIQVSDNLITVNLGTDNAGNNDTTLGEVIRALNADAQARSLVDAEIVDGVDSNTIIQPTGTTYFSGGQTATSRQYVIQITKGGAVGGARQASLTTSLSGANNDLTLTALSAGSAANSTAIRYVLGASGVSTTTLSIASNFDITVTLAVDDEGSNILATANDVLSLLNTDASTVVTASLAAGNTGSGTMQALNWAVLSGGADQAEYKVLEYVNGVLTSGGGDSTYLADSALTQIFDENNSEYWGVKVAFTENGTTLQANDKFYIDVGYYRGNEAQIETNIGLGDTIVKNVTGTEMMGGAGDETNILDLMRRFETALESNDIDTIQEMIVLLEEAREGLTTDEVSVGAKINRLEMTNNINTSFLLTSQDYLDETEAADLTTLLMELNMMETAYEASLTSIARVTALSLVDYL